MLPFLNIRQDIKRKGPINADSCDINARIMAMLEINIFLSKNIIHSITKNAAIGYDLPEIYVTTSVCTGCVAKNNAAKNTLKTK